MTTYTAPVKEMQFLLHDVLAVSGADIPGYADLDAGFTAAVLDEAGKVASDVLAPLNAVGDREGCVLENGVVRTPTGFKAAFKGNHFSKTNQIAIQNNQSSQQWKIIYHFHTQGFQRPQINKRTITSNQKRWVFLHSTPSIPIEL